MKFSLLLLSALGASVWAAPAFPKVEAVVPENIRAISDYMNMLASKVQESRGLASPPVCDLSKVSLPEAAAGLPPPSPGLVLKHIAIGRGTQNYTCDVSNATAVPQAVGAVATLYNASCIVATNPDLAGTLAKAAMHFNPSENAVTQQLVPSNLGASGVHYFKDATTAFFNLDAFPTWKIGEIPCGKNASIPAPVGAPKGLNNEPAVAWLKLLAKSGATGGLEEVYRVETIGGSPPASCRGMPAQFEVQYATEYWFYAK
ncbi:hypothetical protein N656DRAFT_767044 [Canariomyces notabilis]|uniref:Malate dehydrogenase n=1 Tax=Canariomyces notabilis TaxID=2074819 RepID=A0AAN6TI78_9PEZI|nr:hypothetical protein N656DRAFT_767044 [Canariomyces arenarius]